MKLTDLIIHFKVNLLELNEGVTLGFVGGGFDGVTLGVVYFLVMLNNPFLKFFPNLGIIFIAHKYEEQVETKVNNQLE